MTKSSSEDPAELLEALRSGSLSNEEVVHALHMLGHAGCEAVIPYAEALLAHDDPEVRCMALQTLTLGFHLDRHLATAREFLEHDPDLDCQLMGAAALTSLKRNSGDREVLEFLAQVVTDPAQWEGVRETAYAAMRAILHDDPKEQLWLATHDLNWDQDVDWSMVRSYLPRDDRAPQDTRH